MTITAVSALTAKQYRLWYNQPAQTWTQALPVGNGVIGGMVFGIGSSTVEVKTSSYPCYSTPYIRFGDGPWDRGLILSEGRYVYVQKDRKVIMALRNDNKQLRSFITVMSPSFTEKEQYTISEGDCPTSAHQILWNKLYIDCSPNNDYSIAEIEVEIK